MYTRWSRNWICNAAGEVGLAAGGAGAGSVLDNGASTFPAAGFAIPGNDFAVSVGVLRAVVVVLVGGCAIALNVTGAALYDTGGVGRVIAL